MVFKPCHACAYNQHLYMYALGMEFENARDIGAPDSVTVSDSVHTHTNMTRHIDFAEPHQHVTRLESLAMSA